MNRWRVLLLILLLTGASLLLRPATTAWARAVVMPCEAQPLCTAPAMSLPSMHSDAHMAVPDARLAHHHAVAATAIDDSANAPHGVCAGSGHCHVAGQCAGMAAACCTAAAAPGFRFPAGPTKVAVLRASPPRSDAAAHFFTDGIERPPRLFLA